jgi:hypothetical protein
VGWHVDPYGACTDTGTIPLQGIEAAEDSERGPTKSARYPVLARTHSSPDSPLSTPRASAPVSTSVHHDSLRRSAINKRRHPWRVGSSGVLIRSLMKSVDFGARDSGTVENVAWHRGFFLLLLLQTRNSNFERFPYRRAIGEGVERSRLPVQIAVRGVNVSNGQACRN